MLLLLYLTFVIPSICPAAVGQKLSLLELGISVLGSLCLLFLILILDILAAMILHTVHGRNVSFITAYLILRWGRIDDKVEHSKHDEQICGVSQVEGDWFYEGPAQDLFCRGEAHPDINSCSNGQIQQEIHKEQVKVPVPVPLAVRTA